eukprot:GHVU01006051.1.p1 GENE.GHVU01006051.1~~GHVU01006051.1.p1  ORF type:complete len:112 (+),score=0.59 GHVU01006051.1:355-690(+)
MRSFELRVVSLPSPCYYSMVKSRGSSLLPAPSERNCEGVFAAPPCLRAAMKIVAPSRAKMYSIIYSRDAHNRMGTHTKQKLTPTVKTKRHMLWGVPRRVNYPYMKYISPHN